MVKQGESIGAAKCAEQRGVEGDEKMKLCELAELLSEYDDFQAEKISGRQIERDLNKYNTAHGCQHKILWVPKFHCELAWVTTAF